MRGNLSFWGSLSGLRDGTAEGGLRWRGSKLVMMIAMVWNGLDFQGLFTYLVAVSSGFPGHFQPRPCQGPSFLAHIGLLIG
jgi:hypothetical protein